MCLATKSIPVLWAARARGMFTEVRGLLLCEGAGAWTWNRLPNEGIFYQHAFTPYLPCVLNLIQDRERLAAGI